MLGSDGDLVALIRAGEVEALAELARRYRPPLYAAAMALLRDREAAADAVQETFLVALTRLDAVRDPQAVGGWLRSVLRNCCLMQLRHARHNVPIDSEAAAATPGPEQVLDCNALRDEVWTGLEALAEEERVTLVLRQFTRCNSYEAIAAVTAVPVGTVRSRLNRARRRLLHALTVGTGPHRDQSRLEESRQRDWDSFYRDLHGAPLPRTYRDLYHVDVTVRDPGAAWHGVTEWSAEERDAVTLGVRATIAGLAACRDLTILEIDFANPPSAPGHCPPTSTFIHHLRDGRSSKVDIYYHPSGTGEG